MRLPDAEYRALHQLVDDLTEQRDQLRARLTELDAWVSRMPDAGFNSDSPRWAWWHERPRLTTDTPGQPPEQATSEDLGGDSVAVGTAAHHLEGLYDNGFADAPAWKYVCSCGFEAWNFGSEKVARLDHEIHREMRAVEALRGTPTGSARLPDSELLARLLLLIERDAWYPPARAEIRELAKATVAVVGRLEEALRAAKRETDMAFASCGEESHAAAFLRISNLIAAALAGGTPQQGQAEAGSGGAGGAVVEDAGLSGGSDDVQFCPDCYKAHGRDEACPT